MRGRATGYSHRAVSIRYHLTAGGTGLHAACTSREQAMMQRTCSRIDVIRGSHGWLLQAR
jgi:hypothetical protein